MLNWLLIKIGLKCSCGGWKRWKKHELTVGVATLESGKKLNVVVSGRPCKRCGFIRIPEQEVVLAVGGLALKVGEVVAKVQQN